MVIETKIKPGMSFDEYWAINKVKLMSNKIGSMEQAAKVWEDSIIVNKSQ